MKKSLYTATVCLAAAVLLVGCKKDDVVQETPVEEQPVTEAPAPAPASVPATPVMMSGEVKETMTTAGYTYVLVDDGTQQAWAAAPAFDVKVGDVVNVPPGQEMPDYHSKSLDRTFESIFFVPSVTLAGAEPAAPGAMPAGHPDTTPETADISFDGIVKADGGLTVADLFRDRTDLAGKEVAIRGKCVKFSPAIMGTNWIHLQDGTDHEGANDLTITSSATAQKGDTILVTGVVTVDKDFGAGYRYDLIIEDAQVTVE